MTTIISITTPSDSRRAQYDSLLAQSREAHNNGDYAKANELREKAQKLYA